MQKKRTIKEIGLNPNNTAPQKKKKIAKETAKKQKVEDSPQEESKLEVA